MLTFTEYEFIKQGVKVGCGDAGKIQSFKGRGLCKKCETEPTCKKKCDEDNSCTYLWVRPSSKKCVLYSSCDGQSEQYVGKQFKKKQGL